MGEHTPTPWVTNGGIIRIADANNLTAQRIAKVDGEFGDAEKTANAQFIVTACNNHAELVEALREAKLQLEYLDERFPTGTTPAVLQRIGVLLARIEGSENQ